MMNNSQNNLETRTTIFIVLIKQTKTTLINRNILCQLLRSSSSIGANYHEARECETRNDFIHKLSIAKKETNETLYWLDLLAEVETELDIQPLVAEATELLKIFSKSISTAKQSNPKPRT
jgi:four helix bundle protein